MPGVLDRAIETQLLERRRRVQKAASLVPQNGPAGLHALLQEIDGALDRIADGSYGLCEVCHDPIESDRLLNNPLTRFCVDHLTPDEQRALERDLELASRIQAALLPQTEQRHGIWQVARCYQPAGPVSGDYCDVVPTEDGGVYFMLGDISGKGVAASMLMVHLHATFRTLMPLGLPLPVMLERASALFCESTLANQYATLVCVRAHADGDVEIANAGHPPALIVGRDGLRSVDATGLPIGLFSGAAYTVDRQQLAPGETLVLYTDGVTEARNRFDEEFGLARLAGTIRQPGHDGAVNLLGRCVSQLVDFCEGRPPSDDVSLMAVARIA